MSLIFFNSKIRTNIITVTAVTTVLVATPLRVMAKSATEIAAIANYSRALQVNSNFALAYFSPGLANFQQASELFFQSGDNESYSVAIDGLNKAQKALRNSPANN